MSQSFTTVYEKDYRPKAIVRIKPHKNEELYYSKPPPGVGDMWIPTRLEDSVDAIPKRKTDDLLSLVKKLYRQRLWSTYQMAYCKEKVLELFPDQEVRVSENEILEQGKRLYEDPKGKVLQPLATARKVFGFMSPTDMYTKLTEYEDSISKLGYYVLEENFNKIRKSK